MGAVVKLKPVFTQACNCDFCRRGEVGTRFAYTPEPTPEVDRALTRALRPRDDKLPAWLCALIWLGCSGFVWIVGVALVTVVMRVQGVGQ